MMAEALGKSDAEFKAITYRAIAKADTPENMTFEEIYNATIDHVWDEAVKTVEGKKSSPGTAQETTASASDPTDDYTSGVMGGIPDYRQNRTDDPDDYDSGVGW